MASGKMLGGEGSRENHRWAESKVYSRKTHNKSTSRKSGNPPPHSAADDVNSSHHPSSPAPPLPAASEDEASSLNRPLQALINRNHSNRHLQQHHRMATISLASRSREEVRDLRQKLAAELELVRAMVRKLEARESQAAATASASLAPAAGYTLSQLSASDPNPNVPAKKTALSSEVASCRPQVSVSVVPGESSLNEGAEKEKRTPKANQYYRNSEFLLGKERLPPLEPHGHKKQKVNGSKAVAMGEMDRGSFANAFNSCRDLLSKLMKHKHGWVFNVPVDVKKLNIPDYYSIIKRPMDLGTINSRLNKNWYKAPGEFAEDVRLTFRNAMTYNPKGQDVHHMAEQLLNMFEERWPSIEGQYSNVLNPSSMVKKGQPLDLRSLERSDSTAHPGPVETKSRVVSNAQHHIGRPPPLKKPKAKDPDKRDMTFEEKQRLSNNLQNLPPEKLENIVQIIKKRNSSLSQHDDEIEVDIDSVDVETLWELDRFVTNYKKSLSKNKRKEKLAVLARTGVESNVNERVHEVIPGPEAAGEHREGKTVMDEKEVSSGSRIREENKGRNASRSSSSSSSSSDSGSSSSDSDSESSSAYGSDGGQSPRP